MKPIIYEDEHGAWDAVDVKNLIWEHQEFEAQIKHHQALLKDVFKDITKDNRLSPGTFDKLIEVAKNGK